MQQWWQEKFFLTPNKVALLPRFPFLCSMAAAWTAALHGLHRSFPRASHLYPIRSALPLHRSFPRMSRASCVARCLLPPVLSVPVSSRAPVAPSPPRGLHRDAPMLPLFFLFSSPSHSLPSSPHLAKRHDRRPICLGTVVTSHCPGKERQALCLLRTADTLCTHSHIHKCSVIFTDMHAVQEAVALV